MSYAHVPQGTIQQKLHKVAVEVVLMLDRLDKLQQV